MSTRDSGTDPRTPSDGRRREPADEEISLLQITNVLLKYRRPIVAACLGLAVLVVAVSLLLPPTYTSHMAFMPHSDQQQLSRLAGIASQFGVEIPAGQEGQSPQFYADLITSRELLQSAVTTTYEFHVGSGEDSTARSGDLVELLGIYADTRPVAVVDAAEQLREDLEVSRDPETGVVDVEVTSRWPELSREIARRILDLVNRFNLERRQSQASEKREFIEGQLARAESTLRAAEDSLEAFLETNRSYENSPALTFRYDRLQRQVTLRQQIFTSLSESYQQAKIEEVRNTPVVTVVQRPDVPAKPDSRRLLFRGFLGMLLGGMLAGSWVVGREVLMGVERQDPDDYAAFAQLKEDAKADLRRLWSWIPFTR